MLRAAVVVAVGLVVSNFTGFLARILIARAFGTGAENDAFRAAFRIPDLLYTVLAGGALASAFIPTFTTYLATGYPQRAWALARAVALRVFLVLGAVALGVMVLAPFIMRTGIVPGFAAEQADLTATLMRIMLISTIIFSVSGLLMGVLQSNGTFLAAAFAPSLYNVGMIIGATALSGLGIRGLAIGVVIGALLHLLVQLPALRRVLKETTTDDGRLTTDETAVVGSPTSVVNADVSQILRMMGPRVLGLGAVQVNFIVNTRIASQMPTGAVSALDTAFAIMILPLAAIAQSIGTALFPQISKHAARGEKAEFAQAVTKALNVTLALSTPAALGLALLGEPLIRILFERGAFTAQSTHYVAVALAWFALGLIAHAALELIARAFYALKDSTRPALLSVLSMVLNVGLSFIFTRLFDQWGWLAFGGLALAMSLSTIVEVIVLFVLLERRFPEIALRPTGIALLKSLVATGVMGLAVLGWQRVAGMGDGATVVALVIAVGVYFVAATLLKLEAIQILREIVMRRLGRGPATRSSI